MKRLVSLLLWLMMSPVWANQILSPVETSFVHLFVYGNVLDFRGTLQTVTETTEWVAEKKQIKQVYAFDLNGRLARIFYYQNGHYQFLTKIRYNAETGLPEWLVVNDHAQHTVQRYHLEFNDDLTKAYQYHVAADKQVTLVKSAIRQQRQIDITLIDGDSDTTKHYLLSGDGRVTQQEDMIDGKAKTVRQFEYDATGHAQRINSQQDSNKQSITLVNKLDQLGNLIGQQWYTGPSDMQKMVLRELVYFSPWGVCEQPKKVSHKLDAAPYVGMVDIGELTGRRYHNSFFQFSFTIPDDYRVLSDENRMALMVAKTELNVKFNQHVSRVLNEYAPDFMTLFHIESEGVSFLGVAQKLTDFPGAKSGFDVLCQLKRSAKEEKLPARFVNAPYLQVVGNTKFFANDIWVGKRQNPIATKKYFVRIIKGYAVVFTFTKQVSARADVRTLLSQIEFSQPAHFLDETVYPASF